MRLVDCGLRAVRDFIVFVALSCEGFK
jgi:hypothetical protein